jgi:pimeloyl-ACP methyl ester carboxylesterase
MKPFIATILLLLTTLIHADQCKSKKDIFFLIHGIGADQSFFGEMAKALESRSDCYEAIHFEYDTGNSELTTYQFALDFDQFVTKTLQEKVTNKENDFSINLIMHSQGGLVGLIWINHIFSNTEGFTSHHTDKVERFISVSSPFWGAEIAETGNKLFFSLGVENNFFSRFGKKELREMSYGSDTIEFFREKLITNSPTTQNMFKQVKFFNVAGMGPYSSFFFNNFSHGAWERDWVVSVPSMRLNFLYAQSSKKYQEGFIEILNTRFLKFAQDKIIEGLHTPIHGDFIAPGVVDIPEHCIEKESCDHQGFLAIEEFLKDGTTKKGPLREVLSGFKIHLKVQLPKGYLDGEKLRVSVIKQSRKNRTIDMMNFRFRKKQKPVRIDQNNQAYIVFQGSIIKEKSDLAEIKIKLKAPGLKSRIISLKVKKGYMSYIRTNLNEK